MDSIKRKIKIEEKISGTHYACNLTSFEKQQTIKKLEKELEADLFEEV